MKKYILLGAIVGFYFSFIVPVFSASCTLSNCGYGLWLTAPEDIITNDVYSGESDFCLSLDGGSTCVVRFCGVDDPDNINANSPLLGSDTFGDTYSDADFKFNYAELEGSSPYNSAVFYYALGSICPAHEYNPSYQWSSLNGIGFIGYTPPEATSSPIVIPPLFMYASSTCIETSSTSPVSYSCTGTSTMPNFTADINSLIFGLGIVIVLLFIQYIAWIFNLLTSKNKKPWVS